MSTMIMKVLCSVLCILAAANLIYSKHVCPKNCVCDLKDGLRRASCTHLNYVDVNMGVPGNVQIYDLSSNSIHKLEDYCFKDIGYKSLIEIDLSNNMIFWMGLHALAGLEKLEYINLSNNRLQVLPPDIFWYNKQLKILDLSGNKFSFTNRPFLSHSNLKVLNLSRSQISHLPDLVFSELPNLTDLDLSKNFMIQLQIDVLKPLTRLKYLALDENNWTCNTVFTDLQTWIINKKMEFIPQCTTKDTHKQFEKIISLVPVHQDREIESMEDLDELWQIGDDNITELGNQTSTEITLTFIDQFNAKFPSIWSLVIGLQLGILLGMVGTYCWLARLCKWRSPRWKSRRQILRERNASHAEDRLLWNTTMRIQNNTETPPIVRRQLSSPEAFCRSDSWEAASFQNFVPVQSRIRDTNVDVGPLRTTRMQSGAETPPPPYRECMNDRIITNIPE